MVRAVGWIVNHLDGDLVFLGGEPGVPAILRDDCHIWLDHKNFLWMPPDFLRLTFHQARHASRGRGDSHRR